MIKYLLTKLGRAGWENIRLSVMAHGPHCARSVRQKVHNICTRLDAYLHSRMLCVE